MVGIRWRPAIGAALFGIHNAEDMRIEERLRTCIRGCSGRGSQSCNDQVKGEHVAQHDGKSLRSQDSCRPTLDHDLDLTALRCTNKVPFSLRGRIGLWCGASVTLEAIVNVAFTARARLADAFYAGIIAVVESFQSFLRGVAF